MALLLSVLAGVDCSVALPGGSHVARRNFKTSRVGVYKCLSLIVGFAVIVAIWLREVFSCRNFILRGCRYFLGHVACQNLPWQGLCSI